MKKIIFALVVCMFFAPSVLAGTPYVDKMEIEAVVTESGDMVVTENIAYDVEGELNGTYRDIEFLSDNKLNSASNIEIMDVIVDGQRYEYSINTLNNGDMGKYNINEISKGVQVKIFMPSENEMRNVTIKYQLNDVVVKYNDIAELYWNFIGDGWDTSLKNVSIVIKLPKESVETLKVWGHGPLDGISEIVDNRTVKLSISRLPSNEFLDARIVFDRNVVGSVSKVESVDKLEEILQKEGKLAEEANEQRQIANIVIVVIVFVYALMVLNIIIVIAKYIKSIRKSKFQGDYYRELPEDYGPAVMNYVMGNTNISYQGNMIGTLLDLTRKKYIKIEQIKKENSDKVKDYELALLKTKEEIEEDEGLNEFEKFYITDILFYEKDKMTFKEYKKLNEKNQSKFIKSYAEWQKKIESRAKDVEIIKPEKKKLGKTISSNIKLAIVLVLVEVILELFMGLTLFPVVIFVNFFFIALFGTFIVEEKKYTEKGIEHRTMWKSFKKFLIDFSNIKDYEVESMVIWEHYLVYAAGLGIAEEVIKNLRTVYPNEFDNNGIIMSNNYAIMSICNDTEAFKSFNNAFTTASSSGGSGGGFSGSSGGGGGRRWRRWLLTTTCVAQVNTKIQKTSNYNK